MRINTEENPAMAHAHAWLNGVAVHTPDTPYRYCFEADDEAGYIKCRPCVEVEPGHFCPADDGSEIIHRGTVIIHLPEQTERPHAQADG